MQLYNLVYVSRSELPPGAAASAAEAIVRLSSERNARLGVTGALIFTGTHFAQVLEGPRAALTALMVSIGRDVRHRDVRVTLEAPIVNRRFGDWQLAYQGPSQFVGHRIASLHDRPPGAIQGQDAERLVQIMWEFTQRR